MSRFNRALATLLCMMLPTQALAFVNVTSPAGTIYFSGGTEALPSIARVTDKDTGIYWPAANTIGFSTGGTLRLSIDTDSVDLAATMLLLWTARSQLASPADGQLAIRKAAGTGVTTLCLGGCDANHPAIFGVGQETIALNRGDNLVRASVQASTFQSFTNGRSFMLRGTDGSFTSNTAGGFCWSDNADANAGTIDSCLVRDSAGVIEAATTTAGTVLAKFKSNDALLIEGRLGTLSVDFNVTTKQNVYTVPTGKTAYITFAVVRDASTNLTTAVCGFGQNANADDEITHAAQATLTDGTIYFRMTSAATAVEAAAAAVVGFRCSVAQGAAATGTVDVYGYLVP